VPGLPVPGLHRLRERGAVMGFLDSVLVVIAVLTLVVAAACVLALNAALERNDRLAADNERLGREVDALTPPAPFGGRIPLQREATS
jgi:hypothetical protein